MIESGGELKIMGHQYKLIFDSELHMQEGTSAMCNPNSLKIVIDPNFPESKQKEGILHEIIEALNYHMELGLEHKVLTALGEGLFQVLRDNALNFAPDDDSLCEATLCLSCKNNGAEGENGCTLDMAMKEIKQDRGTHLTVVDCQNYEDSGQ